MASLQELVARSNVKQDSVTPQSSVGSDNTPAPAPSLKDLVSRSASTSSVDNAPKKEGLGTSILKSILNEPIQLGKFLGTQSFAENMQHQQESIASMEDKLLQKMKNGELNQTQVNHVKHILGLPEDQVPEGTFKTNEQLVGDVLGTLLWATPAPEAKILSKITPLARAARGASLGAAFSTAAGLSDNANPEELFKRFVAGGALGGATEVAAPLLFNGLGKTLSAVGQGTKSVARGISKITPQIIKDAGGQATKPFLTVETRLRMMGNYGNEIADKFNYAEENTFKRAGTAMSDMEKSGLTKLTPQEDLALKDALEGRIDPKSLTPKVQDTFNTIDRLRNEIATEAKQKGIKITVKRGERVPFTPRKNYFPRITPEIRKLKKGAMRKVVLDNAVRNGDFKTLDEATLALDSYINAVESNGRGNNMDFWIKYLMDTGQATTKKEAIGKTIRFFKPNRVGRSGNLEKSREINFPFYDPSVARVFPLYYFDSVQRLERVGQFGVDNRKLDSMLGGIKRELDRTSNADTAQNAIAELRGENGLIAKLFGNISASPKRNAVSVFLRTIQIPKLAFAQILNMGQNLNTLLATDLPSLGHGLATAFTSAGQDTALRSGATLESILRESASLGDTTDFGRIFLKYTGFTWTEKFNRTVAANAGIKYAQRLRTRLLNDPTDETTKRLITELGLEPSKLMQRDLTAQEMQHVAQKMSFLTQFRSRPADLPAFASSPEGKIIFQYKNFVYNQTRFVKNQLVKEFKSKKLGRMARTLFILGAVFPMTGEVIADVRSLLTGSSRPTHSLDRYMDNLINTGAVGIWGDFINSLQFQDVAGFVAGPAADTVFKTMEKMFRISTTGKMTNSDVRFFLQQPGITRPIANYIFPSNNPNYKNIIQQLNGQ